MNRTIATLTAVVVLTLAACGSGTSDTTTTIPTTTTTVDTRGWSDEAFRDVMAYCQAAGTAMDPFPCASTVIGFRDIECSVEATYKILDHMTAQLGLRGSPNAPNAQFLPDFLRDEMNPAGDCLGFDHPFE